MPDYILDAPLSAAPTVISFGGGIANYAFAVAATAFGPVVTVATSGTAAVASALGGNPDDLAAGADIYTDQGYAFAAYPAPEPVPYVSGDVFLGLAFTLPDGVHYGYAELAGTTLVGFGDDEQPGLGVAAGFLDPGPQPGLVLFDDTASGQTGLEQCDPYAGPVGYLRNEFLWARSDGVDVTAEVPNAFLRGGPGEDALDAQAGSNVLDGGTGSNFLVGAAGAGGGADTFFTDARGAGVTWDTLANFHAGDAATLWGFDPAVSRWRWDGVSGAGNYQGATLRADVHGTGTTDASITFAGLTMAQAQDLQVTTGAVGGSPYLYVHNPGV